MRRGTARFARGRGKRKLDEPSSSPPPPPPPASVDDAPPAVAAATASDRAASHPAPTPSAPQQPPPPSHPPPSPPPPPLQTGPSGDEEPELSRGEPAQLDPPSVLSPSQLQQPVGSHPRVASGDVRRKTSTETQWQSELADWLRATIKVLQFLFTRQGDKKWVLRFALAAFAGVLHWYYISTLFERNRHFSHLSTLEKEMSFRTEMGLYYSYFKTIVEAPSFQKGLWMIVHDKLTEFPLVTNTLKKFNLYPEVVLAICYRIYTGTMNALGIQTRVCWTVNRGEGLSPIESCEGLGDPASFYLGMIFGLNGLIVSVFFLYGAYLSESIIGGSFTVVCYFFNHGESTRVMWAPPLRESFSYPFLVLQMFLLTYVLRTKNVNRRILIALSTFTVFFMLPWQFAQFVLLTQVISVFVIYVLGFIDSQKLLKIFSAYRVSLAVCFVLMLGNTILLTSHYTASVLVCWVIIKLRSKYPEIYKDDFSSRTTEGVVCMIGTIILNALICLVIGESDDHLTHLLKAKFTGYRDFDISMNTCAVEFDFMGYKVLESYLKTILFPVVLFIFIEIIVKTCQYVVHSEKSNERQDCLSYHGAITYQAVQLSFFTILAFLIMRLKLFLTPHMCILASLICSKQQCGWLFSKVPAPREVVVFAILAMMGYQGLTNIQNEWGMVGEFSNLPQEELLLWIKENTKPGAVFAGAMQTMPIVKLSALRPIVNHPLLEDAVSRARTKTVYSMYSRKPAAEVKKGLKQLGVNYYILEDFWCSRKTRRGCTFPEIWDLEDLANAGKTPLCSLMGKDSNPYFKKVFQNSEFQVLEVLKELSVIPSE